MSEATTQKLLVAMICVFGVVLVLIGFGRLLDRGFERLPLEPSPTAARPSMPSSPNQPPRPALSQATQNSAQWQAKPVNAIPTPKANLGTAREFPVRDFSSGQQGSTENSSDQSAPLNSYTPSQTTARHPAAQKHAQRNHQLAQQPIHTTPQPTRQPLLQPPTASQFHDLGHVGQAVATSPIKKPKSSVAQADFESQCPERDSFTVSEQFIGNKDPLQTKSGSRGPIANPFYESQPAEHSVLASPLPEQIPQTVMNSVAAKVPVAEAPTGRIDRRVRKANWTEIEVAPKVDPLINFRPLQQPTLPTRIANPQVESAAREKIQYGQSLGRRRAHFAAREEFIRALLLIATSYNAESNSTAHPERLAQGLIAIDELADFTTVSGSLLQQKILSHSSRLLAPEDIATTSPMQAAGLYSNFAQKQIAQAIGSSSAGSEALHALGKLETMVPEADRNQIKTLVFYRAALTINPANTVCANDLGVLLFNMGRLEEAEQAMIAALRSEQSELTWNNLVMVHRQSAANAGSTAERDRQLSLANLAAKQAQSIANHLGNSQPSNAGLNGGQWATPNEFQDNAAFPNVVVQHANNGSPEKTSKPNVGKSATLKQKIKDWF